MPAKPTLRSAARCGEALAELARRLAKLADAPFIKVEATKFTEVGFVGKDVDSIIKDLVEVGLTMARTKAMAKVKEAVAEKVEDVLRKLFPDANVTRMDSDALKRKEDYRRILGDFRRGKIDILVGTQMIAKGLHFPRVTLVGIVYADTGLHLADFRAGERTFQLLTQVAGRAGRGEVEGEVVVQTFSPVHPAIQFSRRHDYEGYFEAEMEFREQLRYPPFTRAAMLTLRGRNEEKVSFSADHVKKQIEPLTESMDDLQISGPAPAPLLRAETFYRYQLMLRTGRMSELSRHLAAITAGLSFPDDVTLTVDIDPVSLL